jgi:alkaline phosphatase D
MDDNNNDLDDSRGEAACYHSEADDLFRYSMMQPSVSLEEMPPQPGCGRSLNISSDVNDERCVVSSGINKEFPSSESFDSDATISFSWSPVDEEHQQEIDEQNSYNQNPGHLLKGSSALVKKEAEDEHHNTALINTTFETSDSSNISPANSFSDEAEATCSSVLQRSHYNFMEIRDDYLRRKLCLLCVLFWLLPCAYLGGLYTADGLERLETSNPIRENDTALVLSDNDMTENNETSPAASTSTSTPTPPPTLPPTLRPTSRPTLLPTSRPTSRPTLPPTSRPTSRPTLRPTLLPTLRPTLRPTILQTLSPELLPTLPPALPPTLSPTLPPSHLPSASAQDIVWGEVPESSAYSLESGPLVGHITHDSAKLWAFQGQGQPMQLVYRKIGLDDLIAAASVDMPRNAANNASIVELVDLQSNSFYQYEIRMENGRVANGQFRTASPPGSPTEFDYLLASCMNVRRSDYPKQPVWDVVRAQRHLDFAILAGDTVYLNDEDWTPEGEILFDRYWYRNVQQRAESHFAGFIANVPTFAIWDDHDFGMGNSDRHQLGKENSLHAFKNLWANPSYGTDDVPGIFYTFSRGDVQFFVMDCRWYRDGETGSQLGPAQKDWLFDQLRRSTATFKIIVTSADMAERDMAVDVEEIGDVVAEHQISGVLFNAGDIHRNEFKTLPRLGRWPYPVTQITSSGIARVWRRPFALINVNTQLEDPTITASFYGANSTSLDTFWENDPDLRCRDVADGDDDAEQRCTEIIRLSDLSA